MQKLSPYKKGFLKVTAKVKKTERPNEVKKTKRPNAKSVKKLKPHSKVKNRGDSCLALRTRFDRLKNLLWYTNSLCPAVSS